MQPPPPDFVQRAIAAIVRIEDQYVRRMVAREAAAAIKHHEIAVVVPSPEPGGEVAIAWATLILELHRIGVDVRDALGQRYIGSAGVA